MSGHTTMAGGSNRESTHSHSIGDTEEDYGLIRPSLIKQLRSILDQYPDDGQILKELIQNAEDAGASEVRFLYDEDQYPTSSLHHPDMAQFQGCALYAYNNALFEDKDWTGIRMLQDSVKEKDPLKVGRFGLGFKSVLHITDLPSVLSGDRLFVIDPHEKYFQYKGDKTSGYSWNLQQKKSSMKTIPDQFEPYRSVFGNTSAMFDNGHYEGTLFRFPLRTHKSQLSETVYGPERMKDLFESFQGDSQCLMIFLKNIESIKLFRRGRGQSQPTLLYEVRLTDDCLGEVRRIRKDFVAKCKATDRATGPTVTYLLGIETLKYQESGHVERKVYRWLVNELKAGTGISTHLQKLQKDPTLSLVPLVGVAMPIRASGTGRTQRDTTEPADGKPAEPAAEGQVFCFLPLPVEQKTSTGLPVHVNGYFAISQNRRHLKWPTAGHNIMSDKSVHWNQCLIRELLPLSYTQLIRQAIQLSKQNSSFVTPGDVYQAFPDLVTVDEKWQIFLEALYQELFKHAIIFTDCSQGQWVGVEKAIFDCLKEDKDTRKVVTDVCHRSNVNIAKVPMHILHAMGAFSQHSLEVVSPSGIRAVLQQNPTSYTRLPRPDKLRLLLYILKDEDFQDLQGIQLLPCADGEFTAFQRRGEAVYIPTHDCPRELFPGLEGVLLADSLGDLVRSKLAKVASEGVCQLRYLDKEAAAALIPQVIPKHWYNTDTVTLDEGSPVSAQWLEHLWNYLRKEYPRDITTFSGLPVLPLNSEPPLTIVPLSLSSPCVMNSAMGVELEKELLKVMMIFDIHVVADLPQYVQSHAAVLGNFVKLPFKEDLLEVLFQGSKRRTGSGTLFKRILEETSAEEKMAFIRMVSDLNASVLSKPYIVFLRKMPVFPSTSSSEAFVAIEKVSTAVCMSELPCALSQTLVDVTDDTVRKAAMILGASFVEKSEALKEYIFKDIRSGRLDSQTTEKVMDFVFRNFSQFAVHQSFVDELADVPFVPVGGKQLMKPKDLCDPGDKVLKAIFQDQHDVFPDDTYASAQMLIHLRRLGMRTCRTLPGKEVLRLMFKLEDETDHLGTLEKSKGCLKLIDMRPELLWEETQGKLFLEWVTDIAWVPIVQRKPDSFPSTLGWYANSCTKKPCEVISAEFSSLVGSVKSILDGTVHEQLMEAFAWNQLPSTNDVVKQLDLMVKSYHSSEKAKYLTLTASIYKHLMQVDGEEVLSAMAGEKLTAWIWHGDGFVSANCIVTERLPVDATPYIFTLPSEMSQFEPMFRTYGVKSKCEPDVLASVLFKISEAHGGSGTERDRNLQMAIDILNYISDHSLEDGVVKQLLIPTQSNEGFEMLPIGSTTYCDVEWIRQGFDMMEFDEQDGVTFIHPNLPVSTAGKLGVPTLMSRMLHAEELSITGFGQGEPLTSRLHQLLEDYSDGLAIFKEMIQNADDAGATEVSFLYDERPNEDCMKYLIDEGMRECQGPALWVHNNSEFTNQDFINITKLGGATKEQEPEKIGRFGLGFNSVYNITDVPSFVSRNNIVIFDPHTTHLGKGIKDRSRPGIKIDMTKNKTLLRKLSDQFRPYQDIFGCNVEPDKGGYYKGTLFRLPLRTKLQAARSEISGLHYDRAEMVTLMNMMVKHAHNLLLFTQNLKSLKLLNIASDGSPSTVKELFSLDKEIVQTLRENAVLPKKMKSSGSVTSATKTAFLSASAQYIKSSAKPMSGRMLSVPQVPQSTLLICTSSGISTNDLLTTPDVKDKYWLVSSCVGQERSKKLSIASKGILVPVGGVALSLAKVEQGFIPQHMEHSSGKSLAFCFLPLPVQTGLPVHINGTFALETSRRHLSQRTDDDKEDRKTDWNEALLEDAVTHAYLQALYDLKHLLPQEQEVQFYDVWPTFKSSDAYFQPLVHTFYKNMSSLLQTPLFYRNGTVITMENAVFLQTTKAISPQILRVIIQAFVCCDKSYQVLTPPADVIESFQTAGHHNLLAERHYDLHRFYEEVFLPNITKIESAVRDPLIVFALQLNFKTLNKLLTSTKCIPASPNGSELKLIEDLVHPTGLAARLYVREDGFFPHGEVFNDGNVLANLNRLGMKLNDVLWTDIIERAESIQHLDDVDLMNNRHQIIMAFIDRKLMQCSKHVKAGSSLIEVIPEDDENIAQARRILQSIPFLPLSAKPNHYPVAWTGDTAQQTERFSATDMYSWEDRYLVSATQLVADGRKMTPRTKKFLKFGKKEVTVEHVLTQLEHVLMVDINFIQGKKEYEELQKALNYIYRFIQQKLLDGDEMVEQLCDILHERPCVLVENKFHAPKCLAQNFQYNCAPYLYSVPPETLRNFQPLMAKLKVREKFEAKDFVEVLQVLHKETNDQRLSERQLDVAIVATSQLNGNMKLNKLSAQDVVDKYGEIYIPNARQVLEPSTSLCYNDCPWITDTQVMNFTHPDITFNTSACLGVKTKRQEALSMHAKGIPFGQKERLTNSLKRILSTYPCDHEILKELIQNADDAQATEIHFIRDSRHHSEEHVFENSWKALQGPALCVYNNRPFTVEDMEGIQRLGEGSKSRDPSKTGQYGIGFSSVYHLTDAPSVLTDSANFGRSLCVFDPHCYYVPGATPAEPGMRYENAEQLEKAFPDVFSCYLPDRVPMKNSTMMRFPLRNAAMAENSKISKEHITMSRLHDMLQRLRNEAFDILLFANYLEEIKISDIDPVTGDLVNTHTVKMLLSEKQKLMRAQIAKQVKEFGRAIKDDPSCFSTLEQNSYKYIVYLADNRGRQEKWCIAQQIGFKKDTEIPANIEDAFHNGDLMLMPRGGVACLLDERLHGMPESSNRQMKAFCFLPLPMEINLPVHVNAHFALGHENRRHLWSKDKSACHKTDWNNLLCSTVIADAYVSLIEAIRLHGLSAQANGNAYVVECSRQILDNTIATYMSYFPSVDEAHAEWSNLVRSVYQSIARDHAPVLPAIQGDRGSGDEEQSLSRRWCVKWFPPVGEGEAKAFFSKPEEINQVPQQRSFLSRFKSIFKPTSEKHTVPEEQILKEVLLDCGMKLLEAPPSIVENFIKSGVQVDFMSPEGVLLFLRSYSSDEPLCRLGDLPCKLSETPFLNEKVLCVVLRYCKKDEDFMHKLGGLPLLLTEDSMLRVFDEDQPVFASLYPDIMTARGDLFLKKTVKIGIFEDVIVDTSCVFRKLTVPVLAKILPDELPGQRLCSGDGQPVMWQKGSDMSPSATWMKRFWTFVNEETSPDKKDSSEELLDGTREAPDYEQIFEPLSDWCLVPAKITGKNLLFPLGNAKDVICHAQADYKWYGVRDILKKLHIPELDTLAVNSEKSYNSDIAKSVVTSLDKPKAILHVLHTNLLKAPESELPALTKEEADRLLAYFMHHIQQLQENEQSAIQLRGLPLFTTICGDVIPLTNCVVYTLPAKIPTQGIDIWQSRSGTVFLERQADYAALYDMLGCASISVLEVYCKFIFQHLEYFPEDDRMIHLHHVFNKYIKDGASHQNDLSVEEKENLQDTLKDLPFIPDGSGELQPASEFYDPENVVFRVMLPADKFPPPPKSHLFKESEWYAFLGKLGLVREMNKDMYVGFANRIANEGYMQDKHAALAKSKVLVEHLFSMSAASRDAIMPDISKINFVLQDKVSPSLTRLLPQYGDVGTDSLHFMSFRDSISKNYEKLVWTQAGVLPVWADPANLHQLTQENKNQIMDGLEVQKEPRVDVVVRHLLELSRHINSSEKRNVPWDTRRTTKDVFKEIYRFLTDHMENDHDTVDRLTKEPIVLVQDGCLVVRPCQTVVSFYERDEIKPYLFRVPMDLGEFTAFFKRLGATETVSVNQHARVLERIKKVKGIDRLTPNESIQVLKALKGVLETLETSPTREVSVPSLFLPTESGHLVDAHKLVFNDTPSFYDRVRDFGMQFIVDPRECGIKSRHAEEMLMLLPQRVRPGMLSTFVKEEMMEHCKNTMKKEGLAQILDQRVRSEQFLSALARLVRHDAQKTGQKVEDVQMYDILDRLSTIHVYGVRKVVTHLTFKNKHIDGSDVEKACFVEKIQGANTDICQWNLYIQRDTSLGQDLLVPLAEIINRILSGLLRDSVLYLLPILSCSENEIASKLDSLNIRLDRTQPTSRVAMLPTLGTKVDDTLLCKLKAGETDFDVGEYVGYRSHPDDPLINAVVREEVMSPEDNRVYLLETSQESVIAEAPQIYKYL